MVEMVTTMLAPVQQNVASVNTAVSKVDNLKAGYNNARTVNPVYTDIRYDDKTRYNDDSTGRKPLLKRL